MLGKKVIVRATEAGVFFGTLKEKNGNEVVLSNARKLHYWEGAGAVEGLAVDGVSKPNDCRFTVWVESICVKDWSQIIPCTEKASEIIEGVKEWKC